MRATIKPPPALLATPLSRFGGTHLLVPAEVAVGGTSLLMMSIDSLVSGITAKASSHEESSMGFGISPIASREGVSGMSVNFAARF